MDSQYKAYITVLFFFAAFLFGLDIYFFNYVYFQKLNLGSSFIEQRAEFLHSKILFQNPAYLRTFILFVISIAILMTKVKTKFTEKEQQKYNVYPYIILTALSYIFLYNIYYITGLNQFGFISILILSIITFLLFIKYFIDLQKILYANIMKDRFQKDARRFDQFKELIENEYSINIKTEDGWINIVNPFRASQILGTPGSGKSYSFLIEALIQSIKKGYAILLYDFKYPDLAKIAYNTLQNYDCKYEIQPQFCVINFDDLTRTHRCNPIQPDMLLDPSDATGASQSLMFGLYPKWASKQGEFFTESSINFVAACIWTLKLIDKGQYCTIPHLIQFVTLDYDTIFTIMKNQDDEYINNVAAPFLSAHSSGATDQLEGQIGTTRIAISRLTSPTIFWVMTTDDTENSIDLKINNPQTPKILVLANNPDKAKVYSPLLSLFNTRMMGLINKPKQLKCGVFFDELPTLSFPPGTIDNLIATARSNKIAVWLGFQDFAQLIRDLGKEIAEAIINTVGNTFSGMVNFDTAKKVSEKFGKIKVQKESLSISKESNSMSISTEMQDLIPPSEISSLEQGVFVGQVADDRGYEISQKIFYSKILIDTEERKLLEQGELPIFKEFKEDIDIVIKRNFQSIKEDIQILAQTYMSIDKD